MSNISKPNFLYIGASKAGSSWIYECLREHPEVFVPEAKDLQFFDRYYDKGLDWYLSYFKGKEKFEARGELSHDYFLFDGVADKIKKDLGNIKFIVSLREPMDKMISSYKYAKSTYLPEKISFDEFFWNEDSIQISKYRDHNMRKESALYYENLKPFFNIFSENSILILFFDELKANPASFIKKIYSFLDVNPDFEPSVLNEKILASHKARNEKIAHLVYNLAGIFRKFGLANFVGKIKRNPLFNSFLYKTNKSEVEIPVEKKNKLLEYYAEQNAKLEKLIGKELPKSWKTR